MRFRLGCSVVVAVVVVVVVASVVAAAIGLDHRVGSSALNRRRTRGQQLIDGAARGSLRK